VMDFENFILLVLYHFKMKYLFSVLLHCLDDRKRIRFIITHSSTIQQIRVWKDPP